VNPELVTTAVEVAGPGRVRLARVAVPAPGTGEILLRMRGCGLCGTDLGKIGRAPDTDAGWGTEPKGIGPATPGSNAKLGHEVVGVVEMAGPGVRRFAPGDRVVVGHHVPCGACRFCRHGAHSMCAQFRATNLDPCGFAGLIRVPALNVAQVAFPVPPHLADEAAIFVEPLGCALRAVRRSDVQPGDRIAVTGAGSMGLLIAQAVQAAGGHAISLDVNPARLALARGLGIAATRDAGGPDLIAGLRAWTGGEGLDGAILTAVVPPLLAALLAALRDGGRLNLFAAPAIPEPFGLDLGEIYHREITLQATYSSSPADLARAVDLLASGAVRTDGLVTHRLPLDRFVEGIELQRSGGALKVLFYPAGPA
jgi:L-iditol 2-dehydrogenase